MSRLLPTPPTPPSTRATRIIRSIRELADQANVTPDDYAQTVIDLSHIEVALRDLISPAYYRAVSPEYRHGPDAPPNARGHVSYREMVRRTGLAKGAMQRRVSDGAEMTDPAQEATA